MASCVGDYPAGSALTTPSDHVRFMLAVAGDGGGVLRPETAAEMITPQAAFGPDPTAAVGLVWTVFNHGTERGYFGHGGEYMWGWNNFARAWPRRRVAVVVATNQYDLGDMGASDRPSHLAGRLVGGIVTAWVDGVDPRPRRGAAQGRSYLAGMLVGHRLTAMLGITTPPSDVDIARIADSAVIPVGTPWEPDAFRLGVRQVTHAGNGLRDLVRLARREMPEHEGEVVQRQLGVPRLGINVPPEFIEEG